MTNSFALLPGADQEEVLWLEELSKNYDEATRQRFLGAYLARRKDPQTVLICCLLGFCAVAGIHRFLLNNIGLGILYLLTGGLCGIGTIVDAINYRRLTWDYNKKMALESAALMGIRSEYP